MADQTNPGEQSPGPDPVKARDPEVTTSASQDAQQAASHAQQHARDVVDRAKHQLQSVLSEQQHAAAGQLEGIVKALRTTAEQLRKQDQIPAAGYVERAADGLDKFCGTLRDRDINSLATQVQDFARRQPAVFLGGAVAAGFMVARFLKSSSSTSPSYPDYARQPDDYAEPSSARGETYSSGSSYTQGSSPVEPGGTPT